MNIYLPVGTSKSPVEGCNSVIHLNLWLKMSPMCHNANAQHCRRRECWSWVLVSTGPVQECNTDAKQAQDCTLNFKDSYSLASISLVFLIAHNEGGEKKKRTHPHPLTTSRLQTTHHLRDIYLDAFLLFPSLIKDQQLMNYETEKSSFGSAIMWKWQKHRIMTDEQTSHGQGSRQQIRYRSTHSH